MSDWRSGGAEVNTKVQIEFEGFWGHAPPEKILKFVLLKSVFINNTVAIKTVIFHLKL